MEPKRHPIVLTPSNLLHDLGFVLQLKFEIRYAAAVRGGHAPIYLGQRNRRQLVSPASLLDKRGLRKTASSFPILLN